MRPIVANVTGELYPREATREQMIELLGEQVAAPVDAWARLPASLDVRDAAALPLVVLTGAQLVEEATRTGALDAKAGEIASRAIEFAGLRASDVMVPRGRIVALPRNASAPTRNQPPVRELLFGIRSSPITFS